ncbi:hypothetical protein GCM10027169_30300 [Gordonia jinhuaensis]|uniref:HTH tetR-type domain-containing protein n=1 Tax=Gordonia jinhuaensis TaxID=1517702 RepID=A0A916T6N7_9ACTN|nr:TetR/AcrR family transcriptional regulator [Gordonia jinhuaensis]GGB32279.1 hypothetical protein GCM10011489_20560 [Gordonia jinhuaensis]
MTLHNGVPARGEDPSPDEGGSDATGASEWGAEQAIGRRQRKKLDNQRRILASASALFAERGYSNVTTQEIADGADVGIGTVFRFARTKAELLVYVMGDLLDDGIEAALSAAGAGASPVDAIVEIVAPFADDRRSHHQNIVAYQREVLFESGPNATEAAARIGRVEEAIGEVLLLSTRGRPDLSDDYLRKVAHAVFGTVLIDLNRVAVGRAEKSELLASVRDSVSFLLDQLLSRRG